MVLLVRVRAYSEHANLKMKHADWYEKEKAAMSTPPGDGVRPSGPSSTQPDDSRPPGRRTAVMRLCSCR